MALSERIDAMTPDCDHALYTTAQTRALDAFAIGTLGIPGSELMHRAAQAAFAVLRATWPRARRVVVCCGPGNNGGDGYLVAAAARAAGLDVQVLALASPAGADAQAARAECQAPVLGLSGNDAALLSSADVVVDGLFGSGLNRALEGAAAGLVDAINAADRPVLALDVPSGLNADTGQPTGPVVRADATTTFVAWKRGLFTGAAADFCGLLSLHTLNLPDALRADHPADAELIPERLLPPRARVAHKGRFGHVLVVGGDLGFGGAARLAGEAALRGGAGLVSVATRAEHVASLLTARPELMARGVETAADLAPLLDRATVLALGPGLGQSAWGEALWQAALDTPLPLVLDADGLNLLARQSRTFAGRAAVLTPHPGEAARLLGTDTTSVGADRFAAVRELARRYQAVVILKGAGSLVAQPDGRVAVCHAGNPGLAGGGTGDVLGGIVASLMAQRLSPWDAACLGTQLHARAGDIAARDGERGLLASDLFAPLRRLINGL